MEVHSKNIMTKIYECNGVGHWILVRHRNEIYTTAIEPAVQWARLDALAHTPMMLKVRCYGRADTVMIM